MILLHGHTVTYLIVNMYFILHLPRMGRSVREPSGHMNQVPSHSLAAPLCVATGCVHVARALMAAAVSPRLPALCACASTAHKDKSSPATSCGSFSAAALRAAAPDRQHSTQNPSVCPMTYTRSNTRHTRTQHVSTHYIKLHCHQLCKINPKNLQNYRNYG